MDSDVSIVFGGGSVGCRVSGVRCPVGKSRFLDLPPIPGEEAAINAYLDAEILATVKCWIETRDNVHDPFEIAGIEWMKWTATQCFRFGVKDA